MIIGRCNIMVVMHAFSESSCKECGKKIVTPHMPSYEVCEECSNRLKICQQCGKSREEHE